MNINMLRCLVDLSGGINAETADVVKLDSFFSMYPNSEKTSEDLSSLQNIGYITLLIADSQIQAIGVNLNARKLFREE